MYVFRPACKLCAFYSVNIPLIWLRNWATLRVVGHFLDLEHSRTDTVMFWVRHFDPSVQPTRPKSPCRITQRNTGGCSLPLQHRMRQVL